jgi:FMN-dependent oxidoreductase (nitrilotriacetate monooxygenase family)
MGFNRTEQLKLAVILSPTGGHIASWRHPYNPADGAVNIRRYIESAQAAERARIDMIFLADNLGLKDATAEDLSRTASSIMFLEPLTALAAIAMATQHIGLVATCSTTYTEPYNLARSFATLDHISNGRAGWNLVTSAQPTEALNFGHEAQIQHDDRYARAEEYADVVRGLWDSWAPNALVRDKAEGRYFDPAGMRVLNHKGSHFRVRGPLNAMRPPQGHPVIFQAGSSGPGIDLSARHADGVFTAQPTLEGAREYYAAVKARAVEFGRSPDDIKVLPGIYPVVGRTEEEARAKFDQLNALVHPELGLSILSAAIGGGLDFSAFPIDGPVPDLPLTRGNITFQRKLLETARREGLTIRQLSLRYASGYGHRQIIGTPIQIADQLQETFEAYGADGFAISLPWFPGALDDFLRMVVPELQRRGLFRLEYEGKTLRENLGLKTPAWPESRAPASLAKSSNASSSSNAANSSRSRTPSA